MTRFARMLRRLGGGPGRAAVGGVGCAIAALILLVRGDNVAGIGAALLGVWCFFALAVMRRYLPE